MLTCKNHLLFFCLLLAAAGAFAQQSYNNYVGNGVAGNSGYYVYTGGLTREQLQFSRMLAKYGLPAQELPTSGNLTEICLGPIANGGDAELILNDMHSNGFSDAYLGSNPAGNKAGGSQVNVSNKQMNSAGGWPPYGSAAQTNSGSGVDKTGMTVYTPKPPSGNSGNQPNTGTGYLNDDNSSGISYKGGANSNGNSSIQFTPPPKHDFQEDRLNDALSRVGIELQYQLPETEKVLNQTIEAATPTAAPRSINNENGGNRVGEPLTTYDKGALMPVFFVQLAALNTSAEATQYANLSSEYSVYMQQADGFYKIMVGPFYSQSDAGNYRSKLKQRGFNDAFFKEAAYYQREPQTILTKDGKSTAGIELIYPQK
ncbi:hypothetical protein C7N43_35980 [Sphingobacteriales bacterium UPWRP_1]|nr:hypothetical protein B6N25_00765 [Sphingobacteriales bacterium TSM_CSS]PSJ72095.1 hypothetical protein C7N43_35980 [Sphingobacteriales bacterium UPWRP_1]